ncbi:hypothetical protein KIL84_017761 [Mauremys mutica]|uniref:Uncharacterized protein n=1 Tax=Mauremys mutica TaxID=74926 RepID=A0A9D4ARX8_9SAUR|nr:hypothetical protein KIL84_017761 [Mauremys mutica]
MHSRHQFSPSKKSCNGPFQKKNQNSSFKISHGKKNPQTPLSNSCAAKRLLCRPSSRLQSQTDKLRTSTSESFFPQSPMPFCCCDHQIKKQNKTKNITPGSVWN